MKEKKSSLNRITVAWAFYDFANSAYALMVTGVAYQIYFKKIVFATKLQIADLSWALTVAMSILASAIISPFLGVMADAFGLRKKLFVILTWFAIVFTCALGTVESDSFVLGTVLFFLANFCYNLALFIYDSYLKLITAEKNTAAISGFGWGLGYAGGILCFFLTYPLFAQELSVSSTAGFRLGFLAVGVYFFIFSLPAIKLLPSELPIKKEANQTSRIASESFLTTWNTLKHWRDNKEVFKFLIAFWCVTEVIMTVIYFTANYLSTTFGLQTKSILFLTIIVQLIGFPATWLIGFSADKWDIKKTFLVSIIVWSVIIFILATGKTQASLYVMCGLMGLVIGSTQALGRALLSHLVPISKASEFFGFNNLSTKVAATLGPLLFGSVSTWTGNQRLAWFSLLPFLFVGGILIIRLKPQKLNTRKTS